MLDLLGVGWSVFVASLHGSRVLGLLKSRHVAKAQQLKNVIVLLVHVDNHRLGSRRNVEGTIKVKRHYVDGHILLQAVWTRGPSIELPFGILGQLVLGTRVKRLVELLRQLSNGLGLEMVAKSQFEHIQCLGQIFRTS